MARTLNSPGEIGTVRRRRFSNFTKLMAGFGLIVFGMVIAFGITVWNAEENNSSLLADKIELLNSTLVQELRHHLEPVYNGSSYMAAEILRGEFDPSNRLALTDRFSSAMAATPQILVMTFISTKFDVVRVRRSRNGLTVHVGNKSEHKEFRRALDEARGQPNDYWGTLFWSSSLKSTMINLRTPLRRKGKFIGMLVSVVSVSKFAKLTPKPSKDGWIPVQFILYGKNHVLALSGKSIPKFKPSSREPLPKINQIDDPVIARIWNPDSRSELSIKLPGHTQGHVIKYEGNNYAIFYRIVTEYGKLPMFVGMYVRPGFDQRSEMRWLRQTGILAVAILVLVVILALFRGRA